MITRIKHIVISMLLILFSSTIYTTFAAIEQGSISFEITGLWLRHGTPENFSFGTIASSLSDQYISGQFTEPFRIEDLQWYITGHYTTIQCDGVYNQNGYRLTWVELKAGNNTPELLAWMIWSNVKISSILYNYTNIIEPVTYIYKETNINNLWTVNKYWDKPRLKILIPPTAPEGIYSGQIVFSFYMD